MQSFTKYAVLSLSLFGAASYASADTLTLNIDTGSTKGNLRVAVYDSAAGYEARKRAAAAIQPAAGANTQVVIKGLPPATYGIAVFLDTDGDEKLARNLFGAPTEPFGFSKNPKIGFSAPKFDEFAFAYDGTAQEMNIQLMGN